MKNIYIVYIVYKQCIVIIVLFYAVLMSYGQQWRTGTPITNRAMGLPPGALLATSPEYTQMSLKLLLEDANRMALELGLHDTLPIGQSNLVAFYISPPRLAKASKSIGNITTTNYCYYPYAGRRLAVAYTRAENDYKRIRSEYKCPVQNIDTNMAYSVSTNFLNAVLVDVGKLNTNCDVHIIARANDGKNFVPVYRVYWTLKGHIKDGSVAGVEVFLPSRTLWQLYVKRPEYIKRKGLALSPDISR